VSLQTIDTNSLILTDPIVAVRKNVRRGLLVVAFLVFGLGGLAAVMPMTGAVVAGGAVSVESKVKKLSHPTGGVITEILVHNGDRVKKGQILMRLDSTVSASSASLTGETVDQLFAHKARLEAERDNAPRITFPPELTSRAAEPAIARLMASEISLFNLRRQTMAGQLAQLNERVNQMNQQINGYRTQADANRRQSQLIEGERAANKDLLDRQLVTLDRYNQLERSAVELEANAASLDTNAAASRARITEIRQQSLSLVQDSRSQAGMELGDVLTKLQAMQQNKVAADDTYERSLIRAPQDGIVDNLAYNTIGGTIPPTQTIVEIVPDTDELEVEAKVHTSDIDQLRIGQPASLRFSAFDMRTTPQIDGKLSHISANREVDERSGASYYTVNIKINPKQMSRLKGLKLVPGMPVECFIETSHRTMLSYLTKPLADQLQRSFREG